MRRLSALLILAFPSLVLAQETPRFTVSGQVQDAATKERLPAVNVFLAGTSLGTTTDLEGLFTIQNVPAGAYELVVSIPGYERDVRRILAAGRSDARIVVMLNERLIESEAVEVTGEMRYDWQKDLERFRRGMFGTSPFGAKCRILNPEVLNFHRDQERGTFEASAGAPLVIENDATGYRIDLVLRTFEIGEGRTIISGLPRFVARTPGSEGQQKEWEVGRREAYLGSMRHFLSALVRNRLKEEGFRVSVVRGFSLNMEASIVPESKIRNEILKPGAAGYERQLAFNDLLKVEYLEEYRDSAFEDFWFAQTGKPIGGGALHQTSWFSLVMPSVTLTTDGIPYDTALLQTYGYWAFERMGEWMPVEYRPAE